MGPISVVSVEMPSTVNESMPNEPPPKPPPWPPDGGPEVPESVPESVDPSVGGGGQLAREGGVGQAERCGGVRHAVDAEHGVERAGLQRRATHLGGQRRLVERGVALAVCAAAVFAEVEGGAAFALPVLAGLRLRPGHGEVCADAVDGCQRGGLRILDACRQCVDDHHQRDRQGQPGCDDDRLLLSAAEFAA
jgi:hypothetical protein